MAWLIDHGGRDRFFDFYRSYAEQDLGSAAAAEHTTRMLQRHYELDLAELEALVKDSLRVRHR